MAHQPLTEYSFLQNHWVGFGKFQGVLHSLATLHGDLLEFQKQKQMVLHIPLSVNVRENSLSAEVEQSSEPGKIVDCVLHELFQSGDAAQKYMQGNRSMKIDNWILLDNVVQGRAARTKASKILSRCSKKHTSLKQHKKYGSYDFPRECHRFETFMPMHNMWKDYIIQLVKNVGKSQLAQCLLSADLHGAILLVAESKIVSFIGATGIMVRETAEAFGLVTRDDKFRVVPKRASVFIFLADCWKITLHGDNLISRNFAV